MKKIFCVYLILSIVRGSKSQPQFNRKTTLNCDGPNKATLVEHFFNIIFTEFYNTQPICVCVQMCADQPTYCYPNGCFKRDTSRERIVSNIGNTRNMAQANMFVVEQKTNAVTEMFIKDPITESSIVIPEMILTRGLRPDPFKDKYKALLKSRKTPRVELRYNIRDQVKNMKSDTKRTENIEVLKTRWPLKKFNRLNGHLIFPGTYEARPLTSNTYFITPNLDKEINRKSQSKFFKRDLESIKKVDLKTVYNVGAVDASVQNTTLSIETLIENLLSKTFDGNNNTDIEINIEINNDVLTSEINVENNTIISKTTDTKNSATFKENEFKNDDPRQNVNVSNFTKMIDILSKKIDEQNNTSMEMANMLFGYKMPSENIIIKSNEETTKEVETTTNIISSMSPDEVFTSFTTDNYYLNQNDTEVRDKKSLNIPNKDEVTEVNDKVEATIDTLN